MPIKGCCRHTPDNSQKASPHNFQNDSLERGLVPGVRAIVAVASGKGGVGKSTVAANLALGLRANGLRVGVLDADIYGPSMPRMLGISGRPASRDGKILTPLENYGLRCMSMGFLVPEDKIRDPIEHARVLSSRAAGPKSRISGGALGPVTTDRTDPRLTRPPAYSIVTLPQPALGTKRTIELRLLFCPAGRGE
jgi:hypothetical protein